MRILILDALYRDFLDVVYREHPSLREQPSSEQLATIYSYGFARCDFLLQNLRRIGHDAHQIIVNAVPAQRAAARELGVKPPRIRSRWSAPLQRVARGMRRWFGGEAPAQTDDEMNVVAAQIDQFDPDVVLNAEVLQFSADFLRRVKGRRRIVGECAYPIPETLDLSAYDFMVSAAPHFVARFSAAGIPSALWHHAFDPSVLTHLNSGTQNGVVFVGSVTRHHSQRKELLECVARQLPMRFFGTAPGHLRAYFSPPLWGYDMYRELGRARIALNVHINMASRYAANVRLYEATGVGAMLLTDWKENLAELFDVGREVVAFHNLDECVELAQYYLAHEDERAAIAAAGQRRTLRDHTYLVRAKRLSEIIANQPIAPVREG